MPSGVWVLRGGGKHPSGHEHGSVHGGEPVQGQEGTSVGGQSPDDESGAVLEEPEGEIDNEGEEDGAVTVLKLSNGVMFWVPIEVQGMRLQAVVDTAAQVRFVSFW